MPNLVANGQTIADIWPFFDFSKMARVWTTHEWHLVGFINVQDLVGIDTVLSIIRQ